MWRVRRASPTFGRWFGDTLSAENRRQIFIPEGFAHGYCVTSASADVCYLCSRPYWPAGDRGVRAEEEIGQGPIASRGIHVVRAGT